MKNTIITWEDLTETEQGELIRMGKGYRMFYTKFHSLRDKGLCWIDYVSNREIVTPKGRELLDKHESEATK